MEMSKHSRRRMGIIATQSTKKELLRTIRARMNAISVDLAVLKIFTDEFNARYGHEKTTGIAINMIFRRKLLRGMDGFANAMAFARRWLWRNI